MANRGPGQTLTVTPALLLSGWSGENTYQWLRGSAEISGATSTTYTVTDDDVGSAVTCRQTHRNSAGADSATSAAIDVISNEAFVATLFDGGEDGGWYDPSDLTSMVVQRPNNSATTAKSFSNPTVGSVVGVVLDKSQMGGQTASAFIDSQANIVTNGTFAANVSGWSSVGSATIAWNSSGYMTVTTTGSTGGAFQDVASTAPYVIIEARWRCNSGSVNLNVYTSGGFASALMFEDALSLEASTGQFFTQKFLVQNTGGAGFRVYFQVSSTAGSELEVDTVSVKELPGNHLVAPSDAARPVLQTEGGRYYLDFDGVDDAYASSAINPGIATAQVFVAFTKDNAGGLYQILCETSDNATANDGSFVVLATSGQAAPNTSNLAVSLRGTALTSFDYTSYPRPGTHVLGTQLDISQSTRATEIVTQIDGAAPGTSIGYDSASAGTGNFGNYALVVGRRNVVSNLYLNGRIYGLIVRFGPALTTAERENLEIFLANKSGAVLA